MLFNRFRTRSLQTAKRFDFPGAGSRLAVAGLSRRSRGQLGVLNVHSSEYRSFARSPRRPIRRTPSFFPRKRPVGMDEHVRPPPQSRGNLFRFHTRRGIRFRPSRRPLRSKLGRMLELNPPPQKGFRWPPLSPLSPPPPPRQ